MAAIPEVAESPLQETAILSFDEQDFLRFVGTTEELLPVREIYKRLTVSADKGTRLKSQLIDKGLLLEAEVPVQARGRASKLLVLTPSGLTAVHLPPRAGKGGALHQHLQRLIAAAAEQHGFRATIEGTGTNGKAVDVGLDRDGIRVAVEISVTTRAEDEVQNITKDLAGGYVQVITLFVSPATLATTNRLLGEQHDDSWRMQVYCGLVKEYAALLRRVFAVGS